MDTDLSEEISAFLAQRPRLLKEHGPSWVVFVGKSSKGSFPTYQNAIAMALKSYPNEAFLIRHTEEHEPHVPLVVVEAR